MTDPSNGFQRNLPITPIACEDSRSLDTAHYRQHRAAAGLSLAAEYQDEGQNHYYDAFKLAPPLALP